MEKTSNATSEYTNELDQQLKSTADFVNKCNQFLATYSKEKIELGQAFETISKLLQFVGERKEKYKNEAMEAEQLRQTVSALMTEKKSTDEIENKLKQYTAIIPDEVYNLFNTKYSLDKSKNVKLFFSLLALYIYVK